MMRSFKKIGKYAWRTLAVVVGVIVIVYAAVYIYVQYNKAEIVQRVTTQIGEKLNGEVAIGNVDLSFISHFPQVAVVLENVSIKDTMFTDHKHPFFVAEELFAGLSIRKLITGADPLKAVRVNNGKMIVYTNSSGYTNAYLFSPKRKSVDQSKDKNDQDLIKNIVLNNVHFIYNNEQKEKLIEVKAKRLVCDIKKTGENLKLAIKSNLFIENLAFNTDRGSFAKDAAFEGNFPLLFNTANKELYFNDIKIKLKDHPFVLSGKFDFDGDRLYNLSIATEKVNYELATSLLNKKINTALSRFSVDKPVDAQTSISGSLRPGEPLVNVAWGVKNATVKSPFVNVANATFKGTYTNEIVKGRPRNDANSRIHIQPFTASWEGIAIKSNRIIVDNLITPYVRCDIKSNFKLSTLNQLLSSNSVGLQEGSGSINITYAGPLDDNSNYNTSMNGVVSINNGTVLYKPRGVSMKDVTGSIVFNNTDVHVKDMHCTVQNNKLVMDGFARNLLSLINATPGKISLDWNVYSPALDLASFTVLLKKRVSTAAATGQTGKLSKLAASLDKMLEESNVKLIVKADKVNFKRFEANNLNASVSLVEENWDLNNVSLNHANGSMRLKGYLHEVNPYLYQAKLHVDMNDVDVNKVFYSFNNFGQDAIASENIRGKLSSNIDISMNLDREMRTGPTGLTGFVDFSLRKGALLNFQPIQKLQNFLFKNRDFDEVYFAELKNRFDIQNKDIVINRMEIQSTALTLFVEGIYSLKGDTDISIQVPLTNLRKLPFNYKPENVGADASGGTSVFVRGKPGDDGNIKFKYDLFGKFRKNKSKEAKKVSLIAAE